ncbi:hypothetical protein [Streptomyces sp. NRRL F-5123]|uniref:hypothetical protein n=1 Tax=Streptomyces sp. NRRL F-5123 TaxID=1463856 RepID=UPI000A89ED05|nr:hypothetical protein [Streptomyces sp. NRRL F-5123]
MTEPGEAEAAAESETPAAAGNGAGTGAAGTGAAARRARKQVLLRLDPAVHDAVAAWAAAELRSTNAQIEFLLRRALGEAGRLPLSARPIPRRGRPPRDTSPEDPPAPS